ncbi:MAG: restriction endonuclease subunit S [Legionella sp.]|jgi:type I restriction enzyme S subunit
MSWPKVNLGDIAEFIRGVTFKPHDLIEFGANDFVVCMRTKNIQKDLDESDLISLPKNHIKNKSKFLKKGDLLVSTANSFELVGKSCWVPELEYPAVAGGFISILRAKEELLYPRYLFHWMKTSQTQNLLRNCGRQTTNISNMDFERAKKLKISLPPLNEQKRIAAILDKADAVRRKRQQAIKLSEQLLRSVFLDMFGDPLTNSKGFKLVKISDIGKIITGNTPSRDKKQYYGSEIEWIKSDNINTPFHYLTKAEEYLSEEGKLVGRCAPKDSVLITCIAGSKNCIGNIAMTDREVAFNQQINAIIPNEKTLIYFLYAQLLFNKKIIQNASTNSMKGMVSKSRLSNIEILLPPLDEQERYAQFFSRAVKKIEKDNLAFMVSDKLFNSLTQKAFRNELSKQSDIELV